MEEEGKYLDALDRPYERPSVIKRLRDHHHLLARLVAEGRRTTDIAAEVGMSVSRVSILKGDPAFQQLVEMYRANVEQLRDIVYADTRKKELLLYNLALDLRTDKYEERPDDITDSENQKDIEWGTEAVNGKVTRNLNINMSEPLAVAHERKRQHLELQALKNQEEIDRENKANG